MKLSGISFLLLCVLFFSCKKEDTVKLINSSDPVNSDAPLLSKILIDDKSAYEYAYNNFNLVKEEKSKTDLSVNHYDGKGLLISTDYYGNDALLSNNTQVFQAALNSNEWVTTQNGTHGGSMICDYNASGQLVKTTYSRPMSSSSEYSVFSYDSGNRVSRQTMYWENVVTGFIDYTYDAYGNLTKEMLYNVPSAGITELITTTKYVFDSQMNPFRQISKLKIPGVDTNLNNVIKETYIIHMADDKGSDKSMTTETSYEYNAKGYPVTKNGNIKYIYI